MNKIYLLGDIHGREFWKELKDNNEDLIIFVGDYVDPYTYYEDITKDQALTNFKEILDFAKSHKNVKLLVGNHDLEYFFSTDICDCRTDYENYPEICDLFRDNADIFDLAYYLEKYGEKIIVSHAGVHIPWLETFNVEEKDPETVVKYLNSEFHRVINDGYRRRDPFIRMLGEVSYQRGGWASYGSCVWSDVHEWYNIENFNLDPKLDCYQIFGHTRLEKGYPLIGKNIACIDSREIYTLDYIFEKRNENTRNN